jgi:pimeloyl-ACP methyl ester carboxylesterase
MPKFNLKMDVLVLAFVVALGACSSSPMNQTPSTPTAPPTATVSQKPAITLQPCKMGSISALCGTLKVYEDRATRSGRKIDLRVAVIKARSDHPAPDPIFWLAGGPGASAIEWGPYAMQLLGIANQQRDVVMVDLRGTGGSNQMVCPQPADSALQVEGLRKCLPEVTGDPRAYTSAWAMDDVDDVRAALGYDQINLYGGSYGGFAAQVYILRHGDHVRAAAADGTTLLEHPFIERWPVTSQQALDLTIARCEKDADCHAAFPNLKQEFAEVLARVRHAPITVPITNPATGKPLVITPLIFETTVHGALVDTPTVPLIPKLIHLLYTEDWQALTGLLAPYLNEASAMSHWNIMNLTILCFEDWARDRPAETTAASAKSYLTYDGVQALTVPAKICAEMPKPKAEALYGPLANSSVPILFFNGEADPQNPPENVAGAKQRYPNSLSLVAPGQAHGFTGIPCHASILADFFARGSVEGLASDCLEQVELPPFVK